MSDALIPLEQAVAACSALHGRLGETVVHDNMVRVESKLDMLALSSSADVPGALLRMMIVSTSDESPAPRDLRAAAHALHAFRHGLAAVRVGGCAALTIELLDEMHRLLRSGSLPGGTQSGFLDAAPLSGAATAAALQELERFLTDPPLMPLAIRSALVVAWIELLAPFDAASGHIARLLVPLMAIAEGQPPLFLTRSLATCIPSYEAKLAALRIDHHWEDWICFFLPHLTRASRAIAARLDRTAALRLSREAELVSLRSDSTARRLADLAFGMPVLTVSSAQEMLGVSFQTANAAAATLVRLGILAPHSNIRRNRIFIFAEMLTMLAASA